MILEHLAALNQKQIVLASASPRRSELLRQIGLKSLEIIPSSFAEGLDKAAYGGAAGYAKETARCKALDVAKSLREKGRSPTLIIGADTIVDIDGQVLEKPGDAAEAKSMLRRMSGRQHSVHTGFTLIVPAALGDVIKSSATTTLVEFGKLSDAAIEAYIATGEPFDKAGGYGAQGPAGVCIKRLEGCYFNVMGLPLHDLTFEIKALIESGALSL